MEEQSFNEKESFADNSSIQRLSESRPKFKPVLVKKLLADESDDDSDDQVTNSETDEEVDDFDGFQPLPQESNDDKSKGLVTETNFKINVALKNKEVSGVVVENEIEVNRNKGVVIEKKEICDNERSDIEPQPILNSYLQDSLKISTVDKSEENLLGDKPTCGAKRKSMNNEENVIPKSQWQPMSVGIEDKRKSLSIKDQSESNVKSRSYSPETIHHSHNVMSIQQVSELKEKSHFESYKNIKDNQELHKYSSNHDRRHSINSDLNDEKHSVPSKVLLEQVNSTKKVSSHSSSANHGVTSTPMKHPHGSSRPNPCSSHRNIFQTPQNKISNEYALNSIQTPATIFSHWSQRHMAQTPMQNKIGIIKESMQTPASNSQSQNSRHETPRYFNKDGKNVRRPLAETMYSTPIHAPQAPIHGSQLPILQEAPNEAQPSPLNSRDTNNVVVQESTIEKKSMCTSSHMTLESKENRNPNGHDVVKNENQCSNQPKLSASENRFSINSYTDGKSSLNTHNSAYHQNTQQPRTAESYESYQMRESQVHPPSIASKPEQIPQIQCSIPQQNNAWNSRQNKIIVVKGVQYLVLGILGQGMSCKVVRAQNLSTLELLAIKCVNLSKMDKDSVEGCLQEICMLDKLKAPCIVHMYNFEIKQPCVFVVMEIGDTDLSSLLKSMLQEKKQLPLSMILYYWTEMLTAVKHIHENGVIHSDLKPANFLLVRGRLKLIDFGIASNINSDMTSVVKNCQIGTLNYISPEALMDVNAGNNDSPNHNVKFKITYKSDVWSLGCILYSLVYGVTPFHHIRQQWAKISAITDPKHKISFPLRTGTNPVPLILIDVMRKCFQHDPKARPSVAELLDIPYLQSSISSPIVPNIPSNILIKIKQALSPEEWQQFTEMFNKNKN